MNKLTVTQILHDRLRHYLGFSIGTISLKSCCLGNGDLRRRAIYGGGGRVDKARAFVFRHDFQQINCGGDIVVVVCDRDFGGLANSFVRL